MDPFGRPNVAVKVLLPRPLAATSSYFAAHHGGIPAGFIDGDSGNDIQWVLPLFQAFSSLSLSHLLLLLPVFLFCFVLWCVVLS